MPCDQFHPTDLDPALPPTILFVEDEPELRSLIAEELTGAGYRVVEAANGRDAVGLLDTCRPDVVLCDVLMPGMSGHEVLAHFRTHHPDLADVPFIFLTALADKADV